MAGEKTAGDREGGAKAASTSLVQVVRSFRRSRVRRGIAIYLYEIYPQASYPSDIARNVGIAAMNVIGGLRGMNRQFDESNSLLGLGLVDKIRDNGATYYQLSEHGRAVMEKLDKGEVSK